MGILVKALPYLRCVAAFTNILIEIIFRYAQKRSQKVISISPDSRWNFIQNIHMNRFKESGKDLDTLKQMPAEEVEHLFFPPENLRRKDDSVMPDYQAVYERLTMPGSKANLFYLWLKYKKDCPSGYQYTQYCLYFKRFVEKHYGSEAVSMVVERIPGEK